MLRCERRVTARGESSSRALPWLRGLDAAGIALSTACAAHCLVAPLALAVAPIWRSTGFEAALRSGLLVLAVLVIGGGTWRHRVWRALLPLATGVVLLGTIDIAHPGLAAEVMLSVGGSLSLVVAHVLNFRAHAARHSIRAV